MKKLNNKKGFTLAELLVVVAIIAVLVAVSIPVFGTQLEKAREATDAANIRAAVAEVSVDYLSNETASPKTVKATQKTAAWATKTIEIAGYSTADGAATALPESTTGWEVSWDATNNKVVIEANK